jgi:hypothetical protein
MKEEYGSAIIIATHSSGLMNAYNFHKIRVENGTVRFANAGEPELFDPKESLLDSLSKKFAGIAGAS